MNRNGLLLKLCSSYAFFFPPLLGLADLPAPHLAVSPSNITIILPLIPSPLSSLLLSLLCTFSHRPRSRHSTLALTNPTRPPTTLTLTPPPIGIPPSTSTTVSAVLLPPYAQVRCRNSTSSLARSSKRGESQRWRRLRGRSGRRSRRRTCRR
jgi:hypothetical protein